MQMTDLALAGQEFDPAETMRLLARSRPRGNGRRNGLRCAARSRFPNQPGIVYPPKPTIALLPELSTARVHRNADPWQNPPHPAKLAP